MKRHKAEGIKNVSDLRNPKEWMFFKKKESIAEVWTKKIDLQKARQGVGRAVVGTRDALHGKAEWLKG